MIFRWKKIQLQIEMLTLLSKINLFNILNQDTMKIMCYDDGKEFFNQWAIIIKYDNL
jgi:hypothetical protein